jgi:serine/threonine protein kinase
LIGTRLSRFEITAKLGEGGMGQVYRAEDTRLGREVAIKVLPDSFIASPERLARFQREARVLASLNHPNIGALYDLAEHEGVHFLVLELVEGPDLAERLDEGPIPLDEALRIGVALTRGLQIAHERGVVHRDLKPANIKLAPDGRLKILDFGLAKAIEGGSSGEASSQAPTVTAATLPGAILGTAAYMSPEQARGEATDSRADIWSFGVVLWEMLAGERPFEGRTVPDLLAAVLRAELPWHRLPKGTPAALRRLMRRCLEREPDRRLHSIADARLEIEDALSEPEAGGAPATDESQPPSEGTFRLTAEICRRFDRRTLDPRIIGDQVLYLDNERTSDVLVCYLPGLGLDHRIFQETLARSAYRGLALTFYGYEPRSEERLVMSWPDQLILLEEFLKRAIGRLEPAVVLLAGFSLGADYAFRFLTETGVDPAMVDGILSLGCNLDLETCVFSRRLANVARASSEEILPPLHSISESASTLDDWIQVHRYLVEVVSKYSADFRVLQSAAEAAVSPFLEPGRQPFAEWYRYAKEHGTAVRCVIADTEHERAALRRHRMSHLDDGTLGPAYSDEDFFVARGKAHFDLIDPVLIEEQLDTLVRTVRERGRDRSPPPGADP